MPKTNRAANKHGEVFGFLTGDEGHPSHVFRPDGSFVFVAAGSVGEPVFTDSDGEPVEPLPYEGLPFVVRLVDDGSTTVIIAANGVRARRDRDETA